MADYNSSYTGAQIDAAVGKANAAIPSTEKGASNGVATLDNLGKVPTTQLPETSASSSLLEKIRDLSDATVAASSQLNIDVSDISWTKYTEIILRYDIQGTGVLNLRVNSIDTATYTSSTWGPEGATVKLTSNNLLGTNMSVSSSLLPMFICLQQAGGWLRALCDRPMDGKLVQSRLGATLATINVCNTATNTQSFDLTNMSLWGVLR